MSTSPKPIDPLIGKTLAGRYVLEKRIGQGGMGAVYLARQEPLGRAVAVKVLLSGLNADFAAADRFQREATAVARLNHPNVVTVYDFGKTDEGTWFLAMEYVAGKTLREVLDTHKQLPWPRAVDIVRQTAIALAAAHEGGIVHRDLKPDNIMLVPQAGGGANVKVLDFGLAKTVEGDAQRLTRQSIIMGTPGYMAPEQIHGLPVDARCDFYALGVIWWEMLVGHAPIEDTVAIKLLMRHLTEDIAPPSTAAPQAGIPLRGDAVIRNLVEKDPAKRPATAAVAVGLITALAGEPWMASASALPDLSAPKDGNDWDGSFAAMSEARVRAATSSAPPSPSPSPSPSLSSEGRSVHPTLQMHGSTSGEAFGETAPHQSGVEGDPQTFLLEAVEDPADLATDDGSPTSVMAPPISADGAVPYPSLSSAALTEASGAVATAPSWMPSTPSPSPSPPLPDPPSLPPAPLPTPTEGAHTGYLSADDPEEDMGLQRDFDVDGSLGGPLPTLPLPALRPPPSAPLPQSAFLPPPSQAAPPAMQLELSRAPPVVDRRIARADDAARTSLPSVWPRRLGIALAVLVVAAGAHLVLRRSTLVDALTTSTEPSIHADASSEAIAAREKRGGAADIAAALERARLAAPSGGAAARGRLAAVLAEQGRLRDGFTAADEAEAQALLLGLDDRGPSVEGKAALLAMLGDEAGALKLLSDVDGESSGRLRLLLAEILAPRDPSRAASLLRPMVQGLGTRPQRVEAKIALAVGDINGALYALDTRLQDVTDDMSARGLRAIIRARQGQGAAAKADIESVLKSPVPGVGAHLAEAWLAPSSSRKAVDEALVQLQQLPPPSSSLALAARLQLLQRAGRTKALESSLAAPETGKRIAKNLDVALAAAEAWLFVGAPETCLATLASASALVGPRAPLPIRSRQAALQVACGAQKSGKELQGLRPLSLRTRLSFDADAALPYVFAVPADLRVLPPTEDESLLLGVADEERAGRIATLAPENTEKDRRALAWRRRHAADPATQLLLAEADLEAGNVDGATKRLLALEASPKATAGTALAVRVLQVRVSAVKGDGSARGRLEGLVSNGGDPILASLVGVPVFFALGDVKEVHAAFGRLANADPYDPLLAALRKRFDVNP